MKNYTSSVPVETTIARIEKALARAGAVGVAKSYRNGDVISLRFGLFELETGKQVVVQVPANVETVEAVLKKSVRRPRPSTWRLIHEQAQRTAWRLVQDWVEVQLSLIEMGQAEALQVFLPYVFDGKKTVYEALRDGGFKALPEARL